MLDIRAKPARSLVAASILSADFGRIAQECRDVLEHGADLLHVDVMDGHFVPNITMGRTMIRALRHHFPDVFLDVHLMVERPGDFVEDFVHAGANLLSFHVEVCRPLSPRGPDAGALIDTIHAEGAAAGLAVNPPLETDALREALLPYLDRLDLVLIMSVNPGRSGQEFMPEVLEKVRWVRAHLGPGTRLEMDGGLNPATAPAAVGAGADVLVTASALFGSEDRGSVIRSLQGGMQDRGTGGLGD